MSLFLLTGQPNVFPDNVEMDLGKIVNMDMGLGESPARNSMGLLLQVTYGRSDNGIPAQRIDTLVNTNFHVNAANIDIIVVGVHSDFAVPDPTSGNMVAISNFAGQTAKPGGPGNPTSSILVTYDVTQCNGSGYWVVGVSGNHVDFPGDVILYHELSHALHIANGTFSADNATEEHNAEVDENDERGQDHIEHRNVDDHTGACGGPSGGGGGTNCCIIATIATGPMSVEVGRLRQVRDHYLRRGRIGIDFFERLLYDYYSFSPEVCTLMARNGALCQAIASHLVNPLLYTLAVFDAYVAAPEEFAALGKIILEKTALDPTASPELVLPRLPQMQSQWVEWGLIEPLRMWTRIRDQASKQTDAAKLGLWMSEQFESWVIAMPFSPLWLELNSAELEEEFAELCRILLRTHALREAFVGRLRKEVSSKSMEKFLSRLPASGGVQ